MGLMQQMLTRRSLLMNGTVWDQPDALLSTMRELEEMVEEVPTLVVRGAGKVAEGSVIHRDEAAHTTLTTVLSMKSKSLNLTKWTITL